MPIAVNFVQGRNRLPERAWKLPGPVGWVTDVVCLLSVVSGRVVLTKVQIALSYISLTTVLFLFPPSRQVTGSNMSKYSVSAWLGDGSNRSRLLRCGIRHHRDYFCVSLDHPRTQAFHRTPDHVYYCIS